MTNVRSASTKPFPWKVCVSFGLVVAFLQSCVNHDPPSSPQSRCDQAVRSDQQAGNNRLPYDLAMQQCLANNP